MLSAGEDEELCAVASQNFRRCPELMLDFLQSKSLFTSERALRTELELLERKGDIPGDLGLISRYLYTSQLEALLNAEIPRVEGDPTPPEISDLTPQEIIVDSTHQLYEDGRGRRESMTTASVSTQPGARADDQKRAKLFNLTPLNQGDADVSSLLREAISLPLAASHTPAITPYYLRAPCL